MIRSGKRRILSTLILALSLVAQPFAGVAYAATGTVTVCNTGCNYTDIASAVTDAAVEAGSTILVKADSPQTVTSTVLVSKSLTITGEVGAIISTSGSAHVFVTTAPNVTISNLSFVKTDKAFQNMINVQGANTTISGNSFSGLYTLAENDHTSRALEVSTTTGLVVTGNTFENLRQPAYFNDGTTGTVSNNYVNQTRGWVAVANTDLNFAGNTWGENAVDIAFIPGSPNNYTDIVTISDANNGAIIQNQQSGEMSTVFVDGSVTTTGNGYKLSPYKTLTEALAVVADGGVIELGSDLTVAQQITITKGITLEGNGHKITSSFTKSNNSNNAVIGVQSNDVTINDLTVDAVNGTTSQLHGINVYESEYVELNNVTAVNGRSGIVVGQGSSVYAWNIVTSGNIWHGINVDKPGAYLQISGNGSHSEARPIFVDDKTVGEVNDIDFKYSVFENGNSLTYVLSTDLTTGSGDAVDLPAANGVATTPTNRSLELNGAGTSVTIAPGTTVQASSAAWDGTIQAPTALSYAVPGNYDTGLAFMVGSSSYTLSFDKPVKLVLPGQAGKRVGFVSAGSSVFTEITTSCSTNDALGIGSANECKFNDGADLVVWTKHFTTFAAFTSLTPPQQNAAQSGGTSQSRTIKSTYASAYTYDDSWMEGAAEADATADKTDGTVEGDSAGVSSTSTVADATPKEIPSNGLAWYWWLMGAALAAGAWSLVAAYRNGRFNRS